VAIGTLVREDANAPEHSPTADALVARYPEQQREGPDDAERRQDPGIKHPFPVWVGRLPLVRPARITHVRPVGIELGGERKQAEPENEGYGNPRRRGASMSVELYIRRAFVPDDSDAFRD